MLTKYQSMERPPVCLHVMGQDLVNALHAELRECAASRAELLAVAKTAECECTPRERMSGHIADCWMPALTDAIEHAESS